MEGITPVPLSYLVLRKLKQWDECQLGALSGNLDDEQRNRSIRRELTTLLHTLRSEPEFHHDPTYDRTLHNESAARVDRFLATHNIYGKEWRQMGFGKSPKLGVSSKPTSAVPKVQHHLHIRLLAARTTVAILAELGLPCAIFGSMACNLYGNKRLPNDVDILVLPPPERASLTQEEIKVLIVQHAPPDHHFILKPAQDPKATYKVLHFVAGSRPLYNSNQMRTPPDTSCKVDILLPGVMGLPALPTSMITQRSSLPLVPFPFLLLHKLQGWTDHRAATEARYRAKVGVDGRDLEWCVSPRTVKEDLLKYVINKNNGTRKERWKEMWSDRRMFSEEFEKVSKVRAEEFCQVYTGLRGAWRAIGFDV